MSPSAVLISKLRFLQNTVCTTPAQSKILDEAILFISINAPEQRSARPLTIDKLKLCEPGTVLWLQYTDPQLHIPIAPVGWIGFATDADDDSVEPIMEFDAGFDYVKDYGTEWLLWTEKPTDQAALCLKH